MARIIETTIDIDAPRTAVWRTLTDFDRFPEWSAFILGIEGDVVTGKIVAVRLNDGGGEMKMTPRIVAHEDPHKLIWRGKMAASWLFSGEHRFVLSNLEGGKTRLSHSEVFSGILVPLLWKILDKRTRPAFLAFNEALRRRCETQQETGHGSGAVAT
ncbi:SRPBCC domain-containing protein [Palleronia caenipelagi]|uniref:SRPBCC domain-containing protein n=1 Tax=Palleronia caenipelagi TaxID=2489174 RepID=A0A547PUI6_9RHOB|nr:SRPBCC domain-containing protein [Palleronia caenipelagi]TRD17806.1 SRPBCC domain-containing protein [Palleronia caenipelagi]